MQLDLHQWISLKLSQGDVGPYFIIFLQDFKACSFYKHFGGIKTNIKEPKTRWRRKSSRSSSLWGIYRRTIMKHSSRSDSNGLHRMVKNGTTFLFPTEKSRFVT